MLGLQTDAIGDVQVEDLVGNIAALRMLLHKYGEYIEANRALESRLEALQTELQIYVSYRDGYGQRKTDARTSAFLGLVGTILVGFGVNLLTSTISSAGIITFLGGVAVSAMGLYLSLRS